MDIRKHTYGQNRKRKKKKENLAVAVVSGLFPWKGDGVSDVIRKLVFLVSLCALTFAAVRILDFYFGAHDDADYAEYWAVDSDNNARVSIRTSNANDTEGSSSGIEIEILEKYKELWEKNNDMVGYVSIDPYVNYPVVQVPGDKDDDWYLRHNFYGRPTENGTIFVDKYVSFTPDTRPHNVLIHGHNLITKNNFQPLMNYRDSMNTEGWSFLKSNPVIKFDTLYEVGTYKIFSVYQINVNDVYGEFFDYWRKPYFQTRDEFFEYVIESLDRSHYHTGVDLRYGDELLTLSTCDFSMLSDIRLVIVARRVRIGESDYMNPDDFINNRTGNGRDSQGYMKYKMFEAYYRMSNGNKGWAGRNWDISLVEELDEDWLEKYDERSGFN